MSKTSLRTSGLSRRAFVAGALATGAALALAGCGSESSSSDDAAQDATEADTEAEADSEEADGEPKTGGILKYYITNPTAIEPFGAEENQGVEVMFNTYEPLCRYDWELGEVVPMACESYDVNDDADEFTFHLRQDAKFHNGDPVTAKDFKYSWERHCRADFKPAPSSLGYKFSQISGADEMMAGTADELDIECPDDYTLVVHLKAPFADFPSIVSETATAPVPYGCTDTEEDFQSFRVAPIGNGPFKVKGQWEDGQYIEIERFDDYWGDQPLIDGVVFSIFKDDQTAWTEFQAGNLDFLIVGGGLQTQARETYGEATEDGYLANPGHQYIWGDETSIYYLICNNEDEVISNKDLRIAISYAVDRQAICDTALQGTRSPASNMVAKGIPGSVDGAWAYVEPTKNTEKAEEYFEKAGYPADADGKRDLELTFSSNTGSSNEEILQMVAADLEAMGVTVNLDFGEWAAYIDKLQDSDYQIGRLGWTVQVPYADAVLQPLFYTGSGDNNSNYSNTEFDAAIDAARSITDDDERVKAYEEANAIVAEDFPVIPMFYYCHTYITSDRVNNFYYTPIGYITMNKCWLSA
jgi:peptide/nickel transport system substrate-binding protein/oligopeptide transport system substrate-binding protein